MCPQGFSCCTVEMEEKLSQQSHAEIKASVSRLSTNLQSTFKQRHDHFDSKQTHLAHTTLLCFLVSLSQHMLVPHGFLMDDPICYCTARSGDSRSVCWPVHLSLSVSDPCLIILPRAVWSCTAHFPTLQRDVHACRRTTHIFGYSLHRASCSSVCEQLLNIGIRFPLAHGNMQQC